MSQPGVRPIRLRGYYRAVKRGEPWAVKIANLIVSNPLSGLIALVYRNADLSLAYVKNPFLSLVPKSVAWSGKYFAVPVIYRGNKK